MECSFARVTSWVGRWETVKMIASLPPDQGLVVSSVYTKCESTKNKFLCEGHCFYLHFSKWASVLVERT